MKSKLKKQNGFTLIEVVVVLVILAILAAILIPSLTGYIGNSKEKSAITECRQVVEAAQTVSSNAKTEGKLNDVYELMNYDDLKKDIISMAEVNGTIENINITKEEGSKIVQVNYEASNGVKVIYDTKWKDNGRDDLYSIVKNMYGRLEQYMQDSSKFFIDNGISKFDKNGNFLGSDEVNGIKKFAASLGGKLPEVDTKFYSKETLYWKPYMMKNGKTFLFANSSKDTHGIWNAMLIYVDGKVYVSSNGKGTGIAGVSAYRDDDKSVAQYMLSLGFKEFTG